jgi:hypothetical protein
LLSCTQRAVLMVIPRAFFLPGANRSCRKQQLHYRKLRSKRESGGGQRGLTMINVTDGANIDVGLATFKFSFLFDRPPRGRIDPVSTPP